MHDFELRVVFVDAPFFTLQLYPNLVDVVGAPPLSAKQAAGDLHLELDVGSSQRAGGGVGPVAPIMLGRVLVAKGIRP